MRQLRADRNLFCGSKTTFAIHATITMTAALETRSGEVLARTAPRHTSAESVAFLCDIVAHQPPTKPIISLPTIFPRTRPSK